MPKSKFCFCRSSTKEKIQKTTEKLKQQIKVAQHQIEDMGIL